MRGLTSDHIMTFDCGYGRRFGSYELTASEFRAASETARLTELYRGPGLIG